MTENIYVERHSFYRSKTGHALRFTDVSPESARKQYMECGCTKTAHERPEGNPDSFSAGYHLDTEDTECNLGGGWLTFWTPPEKERKKGHAYFMFGGSQSSLRIEITMEGYRYADCFFAKLFLGNQIDTSTLINGHMPSHIDLSKVRPETLWMQGDCWGDEEIRVMEDSKEIALWTDAMTLFTRIHKAMEPFRTDTTTSVDLLRERLESDYSLRADVARLRELLAPVVENPKGTEMFRLSDNIETVLETRAAVKREARNGLVE